MAFIVDYRNVSLCQADRTILKGINLQVEAGVLVYLTGEVGSGKSTLLKSMYGELPIAEGEATVLETYRMHGRMKDSLRQELRRKLGIVFQDFQLLGDRNVEKNLDFVLQATGWKKRQERQERITQVLQMVGLEDKRKSLPSQLSGGEQQRICIARAILNKPQLVLADEPIGSLDRNTQMMIMDLIRRICQEGTTVIMSTHITSLISHYPGTVYHMEDNTMKDVSDVYTQAFDLDDLTMDAPEDRTEK